MKRQDNAITLIWQERVWIIQASFFITDNWGLLTVQVFLVSHLMRSGEDQYNSTNCISGSKTVMHHEDSWRYDFLQWNVIASGKLKFSSPISFPLNTKTMSADIWQQRLCIWMLFFPLPCCFIAFIFLAALPGRGSEEGSKTIPSTLGESSSLLHPHAFLYSLQMWVPEDCRLTSRLAPRLNAVLQVDLWMQVDAFS